MPILLKVFKNWNRQIKKFEFETELKAKTEALKVTERTGSKQTQTQLHYELGMLYLRKDANKHEIEYIIILLKPLN